jgi:hypothetical protein
MTTKLRALSTAVVTAVVLTAGTSATSHSGAMPSATHGETIVCMFCIDWSGPTTTLPE